MPSSNTLAMVWTASRPPGKATICNMGAELGATCSIFPFDQNASEISARQAVRKLPLRRECAELRADDEVLGQSIRFLRPDCRIDLSKVEPHLNGPFTPDAATPISHMKAKGPANDYPMVVEVGLVGKLYQLFLSGFGPCGKRGPPGLREGHPGEGTAHHQPWF